MALTNVKVPKGDWSQVHDGSKSATLAITGDDSIEIAQIAQTDTKPDSDTVGLPFTTTSESRGIYVASEGSPIYVKALVDGVVVIVNV